MQWVGLQCVIVVFPDHTHISGQPWLTPISYIYITTALLRKLDQALENIASITENVSKILDFLTRIIKNQCDHSTLTENTDLGRTPCVFATQELSERITELINETNQPTIEREAQRIKRSMENIWSKNLLCRRQQFWLKLRNERTAEAYEMWRNANTIVLPQKLQMCHVNREPLDQTQRRELGDNCIQNFHLGRYIVGYTVGNLVLRRRVYRRIYASP